MKEKLWYLLPEKQNVPVMIRAFLVCCRLFLYFVIASFMLFACSHFKDIISAYWGWDAITITFKNFGCNLKCGFSSFIDGIIANPSNMQRLINYIFDILAAGYVFALIYNWPPRLVLSNKLILRLANNTDYINYSVLIGNLSGSRILNLTCKFVFVTTYEKKTNKFTLSVDGQDIGALNTYSRLLCDATKVNKDFNEHFFCCNPENADPENADYVYVVVSGASNRFGGTFTVSRIYQQKDFLITNEDPNKEAFLIPPSKFNQFIQKIIKEWDVSEESPKRIDRIKFRTHQDQWHNSDPFEGRQQSLAPDSKIGELMELYYSCKEKRTAAKETSNE